MTAGANPSARETQVSEMIAEIVGIDQLPDDVSLRDLAIDSLTLVEIALAAEERFGVELGADDLDTRRTVKDVIQLISRRSFSAAHGVEQSRPS